MNQNSLSITNKTTNNTDIVSQKPLLEVEDLSMFFKIRGALFKALDGVSFKVNQGDFFGIIGESGSGKSTTGKCIIKLHQASGGKIEFDGRLISNKRLGRRTNKWLRKNVQMVFQDPMASLNPTKNILQIISEPLVINKSLIHKTFLYFLKINKVAKFFRYAFDKEQRILTHNFKLDFFKKFTEIYQNFNSQAQLLIDQNKNASYEQLHDVIINHFDDLVVNVQNLADPIYKYVENYKNIIKKDFEAYDQHKIMDVDLALDEATKKLHEAKTEKHYSSSGIFKKKELEIQKDLISQLKINFNETYKKKNYGYIKSWEATILSKIKVLKQNIKLSNNEIDLTYHVITLMKLKQTLIFIKICKKSKFLEENKIADIIKNVDNELNNLYSEILEQYIIWTNAFAEANAEQKHKILKNLEILRKISHLYYLAFKIKKWNDFSYFSITINQILETNFTDNYFKNKNLEEWFNYYSKIANNLDEIINSAKFDSKKTKTNYLDELHRSKSNYLEIKKEFKKIILEYKKNQTQSKANEDNFNHAKSKLTEAINNRKKRINSYKKNDLKNWKLQKLLLKNQENILILNYHKEYLNYKVVKAKMIKALRDNFNKDKSKKIANLLKSFLTINICKKEIRLRSKAIGALLFEYRTSTRETFFYQKVYSWKSTWTWILFPIFVRLIKRDSVYKALDSVGLKHEHAYRYPHEFSGGQRQRIVIARALITKPKLIIADEPISALDVSIQAQIINILKELAEKNNVTVLFIAHDLSMVHYVCNRVIIMHRGKILEQGNVDLIFKNPIHPYTKSLIKATPKLSRVHVDLSAFDEKFTYDKDWSISNPPAFIQIDGSNDHWVYGIQKQVDEWKNETKETKDLF